MTNPNIRKQLDKLKNIETERKPGYQAQARITAFQACKDLEKEVNEFNADREENEHKTGPVKEKLKSRKNKEREYVKALMDSEAYKIQAEVKAKVEDIDEVLEDNVVPKD